MAAVISIRLLVESTSEPESSVRRLCPLEIKTAPQPPIPGFGEQAPSV